MEGTQNKNVWIGVGVVLVVVLGFWYWSMNKSSVPVVEESTVVDSVEDTTAGSVNTGSTAASISYTNALVKYKDARLQLDKNCQASPDQMTFKNGASVMVDNRAAVDRVVKLGSVFTIKAYGFKIVKLSSSTLPAKWYVDCDKSQNVSTITIQK